jgi:hypothetical protein
MSRLISRYEAPSREGDRPFANRGGFAAGEGEQPAKPSDVKVYLDLLLKMIPAEIVTLYLFAIKLIPLAGGDSLQFWLTWILLGVALILTPVALAVEGPKPTDAGWKRAWYWRLGLATVAFPLWAYATTGEHLPGLVYNNALALIIVAVYAVIAGIIAKAVAPK